MDLLEVVKRAATITGDQPIGRPSPTTRPNGETSITFQGSKGWYDVVDLPGKGMNILFLEGAQHPSGRKVTGSFYANAQGADRNVAHLISEILPQLEPLEFQCGYMSFDPEGVNWKRFSSKDLIVLFKSRRSDPVTQCELLVADHVFSMRISENGTVDDIKQVSHSRL